MKVAKHSSVEMHPDAKSGGQNMMKGAGDMVPTMSPSDVTTKDKSSGRTDHMDSPLLGYREDHGIGEN